MIVDHLSHAHMYEGSTRRVHHAFAFLRQHDLTTLACGRYDIAPGDDVFAIVQEYQTRSLQEAEWEAHRAYLDVQYIVAGSERMGYAYIDTMLPSSEYDADRDIQHFTGSGSDIILTPGTFAIFSPHDVHRPGVAVDAPAPVRKIVVKVSVHI
jgi:YhcH/YjgK/YiaL family protein